MLSNPPPKILVFAGSARSASFNKRLAQAAAAAAQRAGADVTLIDLRDYTLPLYDGDLEVESGLPEAALRLKALFRSHDGLLIASPEYNGSFPALVKNTIDWLSRPTPGEEPLQAFRGKVAGILAASPGPRGGIRGLKHLRELLEMLHVTVMPDQVTVGQAEEAFDAGGALQNTEVQHQVDRLATRLVASLEESRLPQSA